MPTSAEANNVPRIELLATRALLSALSATVTTNRAVYRRFEAGIFGLAYDNGDVTSDATFQVVQAKADATPVHNPNPGTGGSGTTG